MPIHEPYTRPVAFFTSSALYIECVFMVCGRGFRIDTQQKQFVNNFIWNAVDMLETFLYRPA